MVCFVNLFAWFATSSLFKLFKLLLARYVSWFEYVFTYLSYFSFVACLWMFVLACSFVAECLIQSTSLSLLGLSNSFIPSKVLGHKPLTSQDTSIYKSANARKS